MLPRAKVLKAPHPLVASRSSSTGTFATRRTGRTLAVRDSDRVMGVASRRLAAEVIE
jgi:hypothetical protein